MCVFSHFVLIPHHWQTMDSVSNRTSNSKTVVVIAATASLWKHSMDYDPKRKDTLFGTMLVPIHVLLQSLWLNSSHLANDHLWVKYGQATAKKEGHCSNRLFVNSGHGLWLIQTSYTIWITAGTHTCASSVTLIRFLTSDKWLHLCQIEIIHSKKWWTLQQPPLC
jgi:hypothetical protein